MKDALIGLCCLLAFGLMLYTAFLMQPDTTYYQMDTTRTLRLPAEETAEIEIIVKCEEMR
jgi:hypothetical protein